MTTRREGIGEKRERGYTKGRDQVGQRGKILPRLWEEHAIRAEAGRPILSCYSVLGTGGRIAEKKKRGKATLKIENTHLTWDKKGRSRLYAYAGKSQSQKGERAISSEIQAISRQTT